MNDLLSAAFSYRRCGLSVVAINKNKEAIHSWRQHNDYRISESKLSHLLTLPHAYGIAVICGSISRNLAVIDIDEKNNKGKSLFEQFLIKLDGYSSELITKLPITITKNRGVHVLFSSDEVQASTILAKRPCTDEELQNQPNQKVKTLIELIGKKQYVVVPPTPGYKFIQHDILSLPWITQEAKEAILKIARSFNLYKEPQSKIIRPRTYELSSMNPLDDYDMRGDVIQLLQKHGWKFVRNRGQKTFFQRPGETDHETSGDFHHGLGLFGVHTYSTEFERRKGYRPSAVYAILECGGDFKIAAKRLLQEGYGVPYKQR